MTRAERMTRRKRRKASQMWSCNTLLPSSENWRPFTFPWRTFSKEKRASRLSLSKEENSDLPVLLQRKKNELRLETFHFKTSLCCFHWRTALVHDDMIVRLVRLIRLRKRKRKKSAKRKLKRMQKRTRKWYFVIYKSAIYLVLVNLWSFPFPVRRPL